MVSLNEQEGSTIRPPEKKKQICSHIREAKRREKEKEKTPQLTPKQQVVEITPIGIRTLGWRFYIIWTVFNFSFVPVVYLFFPETAGRTLEDIDEYFRTHASGKDILVYKDKEGTQSTRPLRYIEKEDGQVRRRSSVNPRAAAMAEQDAEKGVGLPSHSSEERIEVRDGKDAK